MALRTEYIVVPFLTGAGDKLHPGNPRRLHSRASAIAMADEIAASYSGVMVLRDRHDPVTGVFLEPLPICVMGDVPEDLLHQLAA